MRTLFPVSEKQAELACTLIKEHSLPKILFLSDCYLEDVCWGTFYLSIMRNLAAVSDSLLAIRTNSFFHGASTKPLSDEHLSTVIRSITKFKPDIVFSINHSGLTKETLHGIPAHAKIISLFIDSPDRCPEELKNFNKRDFIWGTGTGAIKDNFIATYKNILREDQIEFTLWGADTAVFYPSSLERDIDISFVGSAYSTHPFAELVESVSTNKKNRQILIDLYLDHKMKYVFDLVKELGSRKFDFTQVDSKSLRTLTTNSKLQLIFTDQISSEQRIKCLSALQDMNLKIYGEPQSVWLDLICGSDAALLSHFQFKPLHNDAEVAELYNRSKIGLNVQIDHNREWGLSFRVFDIIACKALLMTPALSKTPLESMGFKDGEDFISFTTPEDLRNKCQYFVKAHDERECIAQSAFFKLKLGHTFRHRLETVFTKAGLAQTAQAFRALADAEINNELYDTKIWFLDTFGKKRNFGRDFDPRTRFEIDNNISDDELIIQLNSFRINLPVNSTPIPNWVKLVIKQLIKQSVQSISWLGQICKMPISLSKVPKQKRATLNLQDFEEI